MTDYIPRWLRGGGHWMTIYCWGRRREVSAAAGTRRAALRGRRRHAGAGATATGSRIVPSHPLLILLHGLEGSSAAHYMRGIADKAFAAGLQRHPAESAELRRHRAPRCGPLSLGPDARRRLRPAGGRGARRHLARSSIAGYSLGGNLALKLAGDYGDAPPPAAAQAWRRCRRSSSSKRACARSSGGRTSSTSGTSCAA